VLPTLITIRNESVELLHQEDNFEQAPAALSLDLSAWQLC
jgi:hypothetical protein